MKTTIMAAIIIIMAAIITIHHHHHHHPSFALFAVLLDAPILTRTMCVPTNLTARVPSRVLTCSRYSVAFVVETDTLQVTAKGGLRHLFVYPPFQEPRRQPLLLLNTSTSTSVFVLLPALCLKNTVTVTVTVTPTPHNNNANSPL
jgi:hypothetical protein